MKKALILHGLCDDDEYYSSTEPSPSNNNWIPWLQKQLMLNDYNCQTPEVPFSYRGIYQDWFDTVDPLNIDEYTILIGHSAGCGFFFKWLSQNNKKVDKIFMVAPWLDPFNEVNPYNDRLENKDFLQCDLVDDLNNRINEIHVLYCNDDPVSGVKETVDIVMDKYPLISRLHNFDGLGHFSSASRGTDIFPEILDIIINNNH